MGKLTKRMRKRRNYCRDHVSKDTSKQVCHQKEKGLGGMSGADGRNNKRKDEGGYSKDSDKCGERT